MTNQGKVITLYARRHERRAASRRYGRTTVHSLKLFTLACLLAAGTTAAQADPIADFYRGKTVNVIVGVGVGGEYDLQMRLVARHIGKHIPGNPNVVPQNMTGAGGLKMMNYLATVAAHDGTNIGMVQNAFPAIQAAGLPGVQFDAARFFWLGTIAPVVETMAVWHTTGVKSIDDVRKRETIAGASGKGAITFTYPTLMNELLGTKFKLVTGYTGGNQINLAMERGEVEARNNTWSSWKATKRAWLDEKKIAVIAQAGPKAPDLDAPSIEDLAKTPQDRQLIELVVSGTQLGRPFAITPGVPADRVAALRAAFDATMKDPEFLAEAKKLDFEVAAVSGVALQRVVDKVLATPREIAARAKGLLE
jgi:tripartite-type tricarboxylate transporter receptor subunit TctC